jgi:RNA recognition motif-containing protein
MKLYVGNLPFQATEEDIQNWFAQAGIAVDSVSLIRDRISGDPRGFGFVEIHDAAQADAAVRTCNGKEMLGRNLIVNEARPVGSGGGSRGNRENRGGGGGGGGGRGGRGGHRDRW